MLIRLLVALLFAASAAGAGGANAEDDADAGGAAPLNRLAIASNSLCSINTEFWRRRPVATRAYELLFIEMTERLDGWMAGWLDEKEHAYMDE